MKDVLLKNYKWYVAGLWGFLVLTMMMEMIGNRYIFGELALYCFFTLLYCYPLVTVLAEFLLPKALKNDKMKVFIWQIVAFTLLLAFFGTLNEVLFLWFVDNGLFPPTKINGWNRGKPFLIIYLGRILTAFMIIAVFCALRFFKEHYRMAQEHAQLQQAHLEDELRLLRSQINPHMMFNILNHIHILIKKDVDKADDLLMNYSDVLRYQLYEANWETVPLGKEVDYLKDVVSVEKMRWGDELKVDCSWNIEDGKTEISPLLLIPFVENAFKHVSRLPSETGYVNIALHQNGNTLRLVVENSRTDESPRKKNASGLGLENARKRLEILYPGRHELLVQKTATAYKATLIITL